MGFFSNIVRDSQKPPPGAKRASHRNGAAMAVLTAESRPLGLEAAAPLVAHRPYEPFRPAVGEQTDRRTDDGPAEAPPIKPTARQAVDSLPVEHTRATGLGRNSDGEITTSKPKTKRQTGRIERRTATAQPGMDRASGLNKIDSKGTAPAGVEDAVLEAPIANRQAQSARVTPGRTPESRPVEEIAGDETAAPPSQSPQSQQPQAASPPATLSTPTADDDGSVSAKPAPDRNWGKIPSPAAAKSDPGKSPETPPSERQTAAPGAADLLSSTAAIPVPVEQASSETLPESGDEIDPTPGFRVVAALPAAPIRIETPAALAPVQNREEGRADQSTRQPVPMPDAVREVPRVQIGLLEVVVQAPAIAPKGAPLANKARANIASRHYLRNM